jgi:hypothetical protein
LAESTQVVGDVLRAAGPHELQDPRRHGDEVAVARPFRLEEPLDYLVSPLPADPELVARHSDGRRPPRVSAHLAIPLPASGALEAVNRASMLALSPDGSRVVYVGRSGSAWQLFVRPLDRFELQPIAGTEGASDPVFSPDGQWLGFFSASKLKKVAVAGGPVTTLAEAPDGIGISWGDDDTIVYCPDRWGRGLWRVPAGGGAAEALTQPDAQAGESLHALPHHLSGGDVLLFASFKGPSPATRRSRHSLFARANARSWSTARLRAGTCRRDGSCTRAVARCWPHRSTTPGWRSRARRSRSWKAC